MEKKKLRKFRKLYPTREMMQKAKSDAGKPAQRGRTRTYGHYLYARCQELSGIIKLAIFKTSQMQKGIREPEYEIFLNPDGMEFITWDIKEQKWRESMLDNLYPWWEIRNKADEEMWINPEGKRKLKSRLGGESKDAYHLIVHWQRKVRDEQLQKKRAKETAPWDEDMQKIPALPKDWEEWCSKKGIMDHYIFYEYIRKGAKTGYCSYCDKTVPIDNPRHNRRTKCKCCHNEILYKATGKISSLATDRKSVQILQKIETGFCLRVFEVQRIYARATIYKPRLWMCEEKRILFENGTITKYVYGLYKNTEHRWCRETWTYSSSGKLYTRNISHLAKTALSRSGLPYVLKENRNINVQRWLETEAGNPAMEMSAKIGCLKLAWDLYECNYDKELLNQSASELSKMLKIDKQRLARLRKLNGGLSMLRWLQKEKRDNTEYKREVIEFYNKNNISPNDLDFIIDRMSATQIYHYLCRQQDLCNEAPKQIMITWRDYLNMASRAKMQISSEVIYKPKNLTEKHTEMIEFFQKGKIKDEAKKWEKQFKKVNDICKELCKYEYKGSEYQILAPKNVEDIVREGTVLQHCIHTTDIYFDRIQRKETFLLFLRKVNAPDTPYYTLEVEPGGNIRQKRTVRDTQTKDFENAITFLKKWQKELQKRLSKEDKELGRKSSEMRKKEYEKLYEEQKRVWHGALAGRLLAEVLENDFMGVEDMETAI